MKVHLRIAAALVSICLSFPHPVHASVLTGLNIFGTGSDGNLSGGYANTYGGDTYSYNVYLLPGLPTTSFSEAFANSGNVTTLPTRIEIDLGIPGTYRFTALGDTEAGEATGFAGMNLFFNGNDVDSGISVFAAVNSIDAATFPAFGANAGSDTTTLDPLTLGDVPGAGSLTFLDGGSLITLTEYRFSATGIFNADLVGGFDIGANGFSDSVIEFTLVVSAAVPEPSTIVMSSVLLGLFGVAWSYRRIATA